MGQQSKIRILLAVAAGFVAMPVQSFATHLDSKEVPFTLLFKNTPARIGRTLSSSGIPHALPTLTLNRSIRLNSLGEARIGKSCFIRDVSLNPIAGPDFYNAALAQTPGGTIKAGTTFEMSLISFQFESLQLNLKEKGKSRQRLEQRLELGCAHPNIQAWSVSDFEASSAHQVTVRVPSSLVEVSANYLRHSSTSPSLDHLKGFRFNGAFGSGLPGTSGIQLLFGANLKAYTEKTDASLMVGRRCQIVSQEAKSFNDRYAKGSKFAFLGYAVKAAQGTVELVFGNWNHSPHQIRLECIGSEASVKSFTLAEIESDLNGSIRFYHK